MTKVKVRFTSPRWRLNVNDLREIGIDLGLLVLVAIGTWITSSVIPALQQSEDGSSIYTVVVISILAAVAKSIRELVTSNVEQEATPPKRINIE